MTSAPTPSDAIRAATAAPGQIATLILPADVSWTDGAEPGRVQSTPPPEVPPAGQAVDAAAKVLRSGEPALLFLGHDATGEAGLLAASRIAAATGARLLCETFPTRLARGAGLPAVDRLGYFAEAAEAQLDGVKHLILAGARSPVSFFAYPGRPSDLVPAGCDVHVLAEPGEATAALTALADDIAAGTTPPSRHPSRPPLPTGALTGQSIAQAVGALLPERAIVVDESNTAGLTLPAATAGRPPTTGSR